MTQARSYAEKYVWPAPIFLNSNISGCQPTTSFNASLICSQEQMMIAYFLPQQASSADFAEETAVKILWESSTPSVGSSKAIRETAKQTSICWVWPQPFILW